MLSTTLIYEHPGALQQHVCRTKFKQFVNSSSETLGSLVEESPIDTCHSPTGPRQQPTEVAHSHDRPAVADSRDLPAVEASRANPAVENSRDLPAVEDFRADLAVEDYVSRDLPAVVASRADPAVENSRVFPAVEDSRACLLYTSPSPRDS